MSKAAFTWAKFVGKNICDFAPQLQIIMAQICQRHLPWPPLGDATQIEMILWNGMFLRCH
jgi:hypothetical protein